MKKLNLTLMLVVAISLGFLTSCQQKSSTSEKEDTLKVAVPDTVANVPGTIKLFDSKLFTKRNDADIPVCAELATACLEKYKKEYEHPADLVFLEKAYTETATFGSKELGAWIKDIENNTDATHIKICFGVYTDEIEQAFPQVKAGRLSVFLWAYSAAGKAKYTKNSTYQVGNGCKHLINGGVGEEADPFNIAGLEP